MFYYQQIAVCAIVFNNRKTNIRK